MEKPNTFVFFGTFEPMINELPDETALKFFKAIMNYGLHEIVPEFTGIEKALWSQIQFVLDMSKEKYETSVQNGKKGGRPKNLEKPNDNLNKPNNNLEKPSDNLNEPNNNLNKNKNKNKNKNENEKENENENAHISACEEPLSFPKPEKIPDEPEKPVGQLQQDAYAMLSEHNRTAEKTKKVPISGNFFTFCCKEMRELYSTIGTDVPTDRIKSALENFLKVARSDTWRKTFTWRSFVTHFNEFTPEFFDIQRYLTDWKDNGDVSTRPDNVFFHAHKNDPRFKWRLFRDHKDEWEAEGRPDGEDYYRLQDKWEAINDAS